MEIPIQKSTSTENLARLKTFLSGSIIRGLEEMPMGPSEREQASRQLLLEAYQNTKLQLPDSVREQIFLEILDDLLGYGPIQPLLNDPEISEIMVNGPKNVFVEKKGKLIKTNIQFENDDQLLRIIDKIITPLGRRIDQDIPTVDARLPDGSRVNAIIMPVAIDGPSLTIRKFQKDKLTIEKLIEYGSINANMAEFVRACVISRLNIIISGGTGSGKTTLLNVLSSYIPDDERIVTIEDAAELKLQQTHIVRLETKSPNVDGKYSVTIRDLVRNSLRMRPDRIIIGEVRGGEALDMLQAMNTGHDGSLTTLHANSPRDAISRLETMVLMAGMDLPLKVIREQVASAIDLVIQQSRLRDGTRRVTSISEVSGMEGDTVVMTEIFKFEQTEIDGQGNVIGTIKPTGIRPFFSTRLDAAGFKLGPEVYNTRLGEMLSPRRH
jgi:pilus assembly protein CpaF